MALGAIIPINQKPEKVEAGVVSLPGFHPPQLRTPAWRAASRKVEKVATPAKPITHHVVATTRAQEISAPTEDIGDQQVKRLLDQTRPLGLAVVAVEVLAEGAGTLEKNKIGLVAKHHLLIPKPWIEGEGAAAPGFMEAVEGGAEREGIEVTQALKGVAVNREQQLEQELRFGALRWDQHGQNTDPQRLTC